MVKKINSLLGLIVLAMIVISCNTSTQNQSAEQKGTSPEPTVMQKNLQKYVSVKLTADISHLSDNEKEMRFQHLRFVGHHTRARSAGLHGKGTESEDT